MDLLVVKREVLGQGSKERTGQASKEPGKRAKQALEYWSWDGRLKLSPQERGILWLPRHPATYQDEKLRRKGRVLEIPPIPFSCFTQRLQGVLTEEERVVYAFPSPGKSLCPLS
ncbi:unnamed protein product [Microthlaspi erraticum]|uniref:Uncharacterized protein n=1 Tax=Microthlaspi erraticum TaxID=1685480 RepID=A0A6D2JQJ3_9BRAS|nr:unnamed protein product [Microthlaspi erraticum]